jgi:formamidopyrimidine-DNA glycosylase
MPELPEVEDAAKRLRAHAVGRTIVATRALHAATRRTLPPRAARRLPGRTIVAVERRGKHQLLRLDDGAFLHIHFRMAGDWSFGRSAEDPPRHARFVLDLSDGSRVALVDSRALSTVSVVASADALPPLGLEATDPALDAATLRAALEKRRVAIKLALLDQRVVAGLGNIYVAEALWHARIDPRRPAASLSLERLDRLVRGIRETIEVALANPGRYSTGEAEGLHVYDREGERCDRCGGRIRRIVQGARSTYFCATCQR